MDQIISNYAFDTPNLEEKLAIAKRNQDVLTSRTYLGNMPDINITALRAARPELPFFYVKQPLNADGADDAILPQNKKDWLKVPKSDCIILLSGWMASYAVQE